MAFALGHVAALFKYTGISFLAGAVTHGTFSGQRSMWTALAGIVFYLFGNVLEKLAKPDDAQSWSTVLLVGILASVGLGFFTGGLQHFPDSPQRSVWVVPVGFVASLLAAYFMQGQAKVSKRSALTYGVVATAVVVLGSVLAFEILPHEHGGGHHGHDDGHAH